MGRSIRGRGVDVDALRTRVGMLFQQPVVFPGSIADNVMFGVRHTRRPPRRDWPERIERALREAALWEEVRHRLREPAASLSAGQQQRLCLARVLAGQPEVLLLDEPTSALDAGATAAIEELILRLRERHAIVLVTHGLRQARRVADSLVYLAVRDGAGEVSRAAPARSSSRGPGRRSWRAISPGSPHERRPRSRSKSLDTLWFQVGGTVCNLACTHCFVSCSPTNHTHEVLASPRSSATSPRRRGSGCASTTSRAASRS